MSAGAAPKQPPKLRQRRYKQYMLRRIGSRWRVRRPDGMEVLWLGKSLLTWSEALALVNYDLKN